MEEAAKEMIVQQGPPLWAYFLAPAATLLAALVGFAVAYFLGKAQGRAQTLYVKRAEVMIELRRRILELGKHLSLLPIRSSPGDDKELIAKLNDVSEYHEANLPWLEQETNEKVWLIHSSYWAQAARLSEALRNGSKQEAINLSNEWQAEVLTPLLNRLEGEARRLIGTSKDWQPGRGWRKTGTASDFQRYVMRNKPPEEKPEAKGVKECPK